MAQKALSFLGTKFWKILTESFKKMESVEGFKMTIKTWKPKNCACRFCKVFVQNIGFL